MTSARLASGGSALDRPERAHWWGAGPGRVELYLHGALSRDVHTGDGDALHIAMP